MSRFAKTPLIGLLLQEIAGGGNSGVTRYVGKSVLGTRITSFATSRRNTSGSFAERLSRRRLCIASTLRTSGHKRLIASCSKRVVILAHASQLALSRVHGPFKP